MSSTGGNTRMPKAVKNAFMFFMEDYFKQQRMEHPGEKLPSKEIFRKSGEAWKTMDEQQRTPYFDLRAADQKRYESEIKVTALFPHLDGKRRRKRDGNAPKKPLNPFFWYCHDERPKLKQENPGLDAVAISSEIGKKWKEVSASDRKPYEVLAARDRARYRKELKEYKQRSTGSAPTFVPEEMKD